MKSNKNEALEGFKAAVGVLFVLSVCIAICYLFIAGVNAIVDSMVNGRSMPEMLIVVIKTLFLLGGCGYMFYVGYFLSDDQEGWTTFWFTMFMVLIGIAVSVFIIRGYPLAAR